MDQYHRTFTVNSTKAKISAVLPISNFWYAEVPPLFAMTVCVGIARSAGYERLPEALRADISHAERRV